MTRKPILKDILAGEWSISKKYIDEETGFVYVFRWGKHGDYYNKIETADVFEMISEIGKLVKKEKA